MYEQKKTYPNSQNVSMVAGDDAYLQLKVIRIKL